MREKFKEYTWEADPVKLTMEMTAIRSYSFMERQEEEISEYIELFFNSHDIKTWRNEIVPGRFNTFAILEGYDRENAPSLLLSGHMDTVPAYDFENAYEPWDDGEYLHGRGVVDMKGALACMMTAMVRIKDEGVKLRGDLIFCAVADEEEAGIGTGDLIKTGPEATYAIIGEPSCMEIALGQKGLEWIEVSFEGKKVHGGAQRDGVNAIVMASRFIQKIENEYRPVLDRRQHPFLGSGTINIGTITGGDQPSTVADRCSIRLDRRCVPPETIEQVYGELQAIVDELHEEDPKFKATIRDVFDGTTLPHIPFCISPESPLAKAASKAIKATGIEPKFTVFPAWTDAGFIAAGGDTKCIVLGPGELHVAHSINERVAKSELKRATEVYYLIALDICG